MVDPATVLAHDGALLNKHVHKITALLHNCSRKNGITFYR
jgi:hypothetical protein